MAIDRTDVSGRKAAILANALLQDVGLISKHDLSRVMDYSKIKREKILYYELLEKYTVSHSLKGIYFDGKKDKTLTQQKEGEKYYRKEIIEDHVSILQEPADKYIGHVTPKSGSVKDLAQSLCDFLETSEIDETKIGIYHVFIFEFPYIDLHLKKSI